MYEGISLPKGFKRLNNQPLDADSVFDNIEDAEKYAKSPTAYPGQILSVKIKKTWKIFIIGENNNLEEQIASSEPGSISNITWEEI